MARPPKVQPPSLGNILQYARSKTDVLDWPTLQSVLVLVYQVQESHKAREHALTSARLEALASEVRYLVNGTLALQLGPDPDDCGCLTPKAMPPASRDCDCEGDCSCHISTCRVCNSASDDLAYSHVMAEDGADVLCCPSCRDKRMADWMQRQLDQYADTPAPRHKGSVAARRHRLRKTKG